MSRIIIFIAICFVSIFQASGQSSVEEEVKSFLYRAFELNMEEKYSEAITCYEKALDGYGRLGIVSGEVFVLKQLAIINSHFGNYDDAIAFCERALPLTKRINHDAWQMETIKMLCHLNGLSGNMDRREHYHKAMDSLYLSTNDKDARFIYCSHKGEEFKEHENYRLAEQWLKKAVDVAEEQAVEGNMGNLYSSYYDLGMLLFYEERYGESQDYLRLSLRDEEVTADNYMTYIVLSQIYCATGDLSRAMECLDRLFLIREQIGEPRQLSKLYSMRGYCCLTRKDYVAALEDYKEADRIMSCYPLYDVDRTDLYGMIGGVEHVLGHYEESEYYYQLYFDSIKNTDGTSGLNLINAQIYLAQAQGFAGHITEGCESYTCAVDKLKAFVRRRLPYMNTAEREALWKRLCPLLANMTPYALASGCFQTAYTKACYDALVLSKAFLLDTERSISDIVQRNGDAHDMQTYMKIAALNDRISDWERNYDVYADSIRIAFDEVSRLESRLLARCRTVGRLTSFMNVDYDAIKDVLKEDEVLVDFTDFVSKKEGRSYAAYIIDKNQQCPLLKPLFAESVIDSLGIVHPDMFYDRALSADVLSLIWEPLAEHVKDGSTIYYVPSSLLFQVCLESLPLDDGTLLGEHYDFVRLSSARELIRRRSSTFARLSQTAVLYGGLKFDQDSGDGPARSDGYQNLPSTEEEVTKIKDVLERCGFAVDSFTGIDGTEASLLNLSGRSPGILHLATHGFYYEPAAAAEVDYLKGYTDAMFLSGLILSGGNAAWRGNGVSRDVDDGILTANEISCLDLSGTDMVVLSACRSGRGGVTSEGLYGLQRGFKKAGAGTLVMTLWDVMDHVASEFMISFYEALSENRWDKRRAFESAKQEVRERYPEPADWAAFVLLD